MLTRVFANVSSIKELQPGWNWEDSKNRKTGPDKFNDPSNAVGNETIPGVGTCVKAKEDKITSCRVGDDGSGNASSHRVAVSADDSDSSDHSVALM